MKIAIFGAGAIGGYLGVKLHQAGAEVCFIARGAHLAAMQKNGVTLKSAGETVTVRPVCTGDPREAGIQDYVVVTLKAHSLSAAEASESSEIAECHSIIFILSNSPIRCPQGH